MSNVAKAPPPPLIISDKKDHSARYPYRFSLPQISTMFNLTIPTIRKRLGDIPVAPSVGRRSKVYDIADIATLRDVRVGITNAKPISGDDKDGIVPVDADGEPTIQLSPAKAKVFYQVEDLKESRRAKRLKNDVLERSLIPASEIEAVQAAAYKPVATFIDNLADMLERNGLITNEDVPRVMEMTDKIRNQLADDMQQQFGSRQ